MYVCMYVYMYVCTCYPQCMCVFMTHTFTYNQIFSQFWSVIDAMCPPPQLRTPREVDAERRLEQIALLKMHAAKCARDTRLEVMETLLSCVTGAEVCMCVYFV
jgi:hypothetical protein